MQKKSSIEEISVKDDSLFIKTHEMVCGSFM